MIAKQKTGHRVINKRVESKNSVNSHDIYDLCELCG